jgi:hypothetical protein
MHFYEFWYSTFVSSYQISSCHLFYMNGISADIIMLLLGK